MNETLLNISSRKIKGFFWREPATGCGGDYFYEDCNARPVINVFDKYKRGKTGGDDVTEPALEDFLARYLKPRQ